MMTPRSGIFLIRRKKEKRRGPHLKKLVHMTEKDETDALCGNTADAISDNAPETAGTAQTGDSSYDHILKYTGLLGGVQVISVLISVVRNKIAALLIGAAGMGLSDLYMRFIDLMGSMTNFGITLSAVPRMSELHERGAGRALGHYVRLVRTWVLLTALLGLAATLAAAPLVCRLATGSYADTGYFCLLAPAVSLSTVLAGELAVLKGLRRLRRLATVSTLCAVLTLAVTVTFYLLMGIRGIAPAILISSAGLLWLHLRASTRLVPYRVSPRSPRFVRQGFHLIKLGSAYIVAGIITSGAEMLIRSGIVRADGMTAAGFYAVGFTLTVSYARLIFVAMDADYFPRLSAVVKDTPMMRETANKQIDVLVLLMAPVLILFALSLPLVVRLLYTSEFLTVIPMVLCAACYMYFKAVCYPVAYLSLAAGDALLYMTMEVAYDVVFVVFVLGGYHIGGLAGAGAGLSLSNLFDLLLVSTVYSRRYGFRYEGATLRRCGVQFLLLAAGLLAASSADLLPRLVAGTAVFILSAAYSWRIMSRESTVFSRLADRLRRGKKS